jgi:hypothetical protein
LAIFQPGRQMFKRAHKSAHAQLGAADRGEHREAAEPVVKILVRSEMQRKKERGRCDIIASIRGAE